MCLSSIYKFTRSDFVVSFMHVMWFTLTTAVFFLQYSCSFFHYNHYCFIAYLWYLVFVPIDKYFTCADSRQIVLDVCNSQILYCLRNQQDLKLVTQNLSDLLAAIYKHKVYYCWESDWCVCCSLLDKKVFIINSVSWLQCDVYERLF